MSTETVETNGVYVYMLRCRDGSLYTGYTTNLAERFAKHCAGAGAKYTKSHPPVSIAAAWQVASKSDALRLECRIKSLGKRKKEALILNPSQLCAEGDAASVVSTQ